MNAVIRPLLKVLSCPLIILTLGLFVLVINGVTLLIAAKIADSIGIGFHVDGFLPAFLGALIVPNLEALEKYASQQKIGYVSKEDLLENPQILELVSELADDIRNYLDGNPLIAGPETASYRVKKFVWKHASAVATRPRGVRIR